MRIYTHIDFTFKYSTWYQVPARWILMSIEMCNVYLNLSRARAISYLDVCCFLLHMQRILFFQRWNGRLMKLSSVYSLTLSFNSFWINWKCSTFRVYASAILYLPTVVHFYVGRLCKFHHFKTEKTQKFILYVFTDANIKFEPVIFKYQDQGSF